MDALQRKLPFSVDAEQSVLGSILCDPNCFGEVAEIISMDDFYLEEHKKIYEVFLDFSYQNRLLTLLQL